MEELKHYREAIRRAHPGQVFEDSVELLRQAREEVTNILYRQSVSGKLTYDESRRGLEKLFSLEIQLKFSLYEEVSAQAMEFAQRFHLPATYDAHYLALAYEEQCECWTADRRLWTAVTRELNWVRWLGEYQPELH